MDYTIRRLKQEETGILDTFLYEAIFIPEGVEAPPRDIINQPELQVYVDDFGNRAGDMAFVAETNDKVVGAVWVRIMDDYGHVDDDTHFCNLTAQRIQELRHWNGADEKDAGGAEKLWI